jgi:hypothetical protein
MFWFVFGGFQKKLAHFHVFIPLAREIWNCNFKRTQTKFSQMLNSSRLISPFSYLSPMLIRPLIIISRREYIYIYIYAGPEVLTLNKYSEFSLNKSRKNKNGN